MSIHRANLTEMHTAPAWMQRYLERLIAATGYNGAVAIVTCDPAVFEQGRIGVTDDPDGFCVLRDEPPDLIVLPDDAAESNYYEGLIRHEFVHVLHGRVDRLVRAHISEEVLEQYMQEVEAFVEPFTALLMLAAKLGVPVEVESLRADYAKAYDALLRIEGRAAGEIFQIASHALANMAHPQDQE